MSLIDDWFTHVKPMKDHIHNLALSDNPERAAYYADGTIEALAYMLAKAEVPVPGKVNNEV